MLLSIVKYVKKRRIRVGRDAGTSDVIGLTKFMTSPTPDTSANTRWTARRIESVRIAEAVSTASRPRTIPPPIERGEIA
jgi:hypothetical protein